MYCNYKFGPAIGVQNALETFLASTPSKTIHDNQKIKDWV